ncbi:tripartite tricarboxylate transporter permease [Orrella marina]|uniref:C4-dicarboxylate ABC transporter permease n=1 Tax=Orrella marina TaxID=2163011 RepID=A0A2R4XKS6_9BURK|nr:tripartite tricarboxylate transporter permease [Orrella marina]AWB34422.1 C4-dicarboxylate ABC transporter permease [Orrella marina]
MIEWFADLSSGFSQAWQFSLLLSSILGVIVGVVIGVVPGLGPAMAIALAIPLTYSLGPLVAISLMLGIYKGGTYGGSISAILINTPGTPAAAATTLDGYPLALKGQSGKALNIALIASVIGDAIGIFFLCILAQPLAAIALKFGPTELASLLLFALTVIAALSGNSLLKGLIAAGIGMLLGTIGMDNVAGLTRFTFGFIALDDGLQIIPMVIGLFAMAEILKQAEQIVKHDKGALLPAPNTPSDNVATLPDIKRCTPNFLTSSVIGTAIGALPGTGSTTAAYLSYAVARRRSKNPEEFGKGSIEGLAAAESGNNAVCGGALIPMMTLGIPGDVVTAILMSALTVHGIHVGPLIFQNNREFVFTIFGLLLLSVVALYFVGRASIAAFRRMSLLPQAIIMPIVLMLCIIGAYSTNYSLMDVWVMLLFGLIGYIMIKLDIPLPPLIIAFVLTPQWEQSMRLALMMSSGDFTTFVTKPISLGFLLLTLFVIVNVARSSIRKGRAIP